MCVFLGGEKKLVKYFADVSQATMRISANRMHPSHITKRRAQLYRRGIIKGDDCGYQVFHGCSLQNIQRNNRPINNIFKTNMAFMP
jgi:hypothetical protein